MSDILYKEESFKIVGILYEVHSQLGGGFLEVVYKDALEYEFKTAGISYEREKEFKVKYKDSFLPHMFYSDFTVYDKIILEVKSCAEFHDAHIAQCLNYLKVSGNKLAIIANFNKHRLDYKRIII
ncbi:MAG TPA: GxxExxY protein [Flavobacterium sp.]|jgi:GxxExxY protein